jgi:hypothetical protein
VTRNIQTLVKNLVPSHSFYIFLSMALAAHSGPCLFIQFRNNFLQTVGLLGRVISPSQDLYLNTGQHKHRINSYKHQTSILHVGFEPTIPASEREETVNAPHRATLVTGTDIIYIYIYYITTIYSSYITTLFQCLQIH